MSFILPHSCSDFKKNEISTLAEIRSRGFFESDFEELATDISTAYNKYIGYVKNGRKNIKVDFNFASNFEIEIQERKSRVVIHAEVRGDYDITTYSIGICSEGDVTELIRRFHFDYVHENGGKKQKVPISHLQYGGKSGGTQGDITFNTSKIEQWLSQPRLYHPPINIALLLDIVFTEFRNEKTLKITDDSDWRSLIRKNEIYAFKDYYKTIADHIDTARHTQKSQIGRAHV